MNFKRYHVSRNLFDKDNTTIYNAYFAENGSWNPSTDSRSILIPVSPNTEYTLSISRSSPIFRIYETILENPQPDSQFQVIVRTTDISSYTFTTGSNTKYIGFQESGVLVDDWFNSLMLNTGSTALPYEPYSTEVWHDTPHYIHNTSTDTITTLPAVLYPNAATATVGLKGNTVQNGTPTPDNPVMPQGTGDKTANLSPSLDNWTAGFLNYQGVYQSAGSVTREKISDYVPIEPSTTYSFSREDGFPAGSDVAWCAIGFFDVNKEFIVRPSSTSTSFLTATSPNNARYCRMMFRTYGQTKEPILNASPDVLPYEPFGYKIPISSVSTTTPVYLGEVQTTRRIKKLVLTGEETSWYASSGFMYNDTIQPDYLRSTATTLICSHYKAIGGAVGGGDVSNGQCALYRFSSVQRLYIRDNNYTTAEDFKSFLAQQYAAGTPVTVWYVLATEETGIVNEPLMKIGSYADSISGISIPTTAGANTLDVQTTVTPSEVTASFNGWHPVAAAHERENGAWT